MNKTKHTPGPWTIVSDAQGPCMVMHPKRSGVAIASLTELFHPANGFHSPTVSEPEPCPEAYNGDTYHVERVANCRLIAAAPDLLEALEEFLSLRSEEEIAAAPSDSILGKARAAISRATGES